MCITKINPLLREAPATPQEEANVYDAVYVSKDENGLQMEDSKFEMRKMMILCPEVFSKSKTLCILDPEEQIYEDPSMYDVVPNKTDTKSWSNQTWKMHGKSTVHKKNLSNFLENEGIFSEEQI